MSKNTRKIIERNRKRRVVRTVISFMFVSMIAFTMFFAGIKVSAVTTDAQSLDTGSATKMYKSVMVEQNDCLWDIAERNMGVGYNDINDYIEEIIIINNLTGTDIHFGEYICVPYYA